MMYLAYMKHSLVTKKDLKKFMKLLNVILRLERKVFRASDLFSAFMEERKNTGRIYLMNVDHANDRRIFRKDS